MRGSTKKDVLDCATGSNRRLKNCGGSPRGPTSSSRRRRRQELNVDQAASITEMQSAREPTNAKRQGSDGGECGIS